MKLLQESFAVCPVNSPTFFGWQRDLPGDEIDFVMVRGYAAAFVW